MWPSHRTVIAILLLVAGVVDGIEAPVEFSPKGQPDITLEGLLQVPEVEKAAGGVVLCHPDPRYGGNMGSNVITALQRALARRGLATLRFNFRGVGNSEGEFDDGDGELFDCLGAVDKLCDCQQVDPKRVAIVGYSWGAWVGLRASVTAHGDDDGDWPCACACIAFPVGPDTKAAGHSYLKKVTFPTLFVTGTSDTIADLSVTRRLIDIHDVDEYCRVSPIDDATHFFSDTALLTGAVGRIADFISGHIGPQPAGP